MSKNCSIMTRMKENYENRSKTFLTRRVPVIIRLDGKAFHTYTKGLNKPFDEGLIEDMHLIAKYLCENIQNCKLAYTQSDEISLLLTDYEKHTTQAWFDYNVQKMTSISASLATAKFNQVRYWREYDLRRKIILNKSNPGFFATQEEADNYNPKTAFKGHLKDMPLAMFDSRVFNIPKKEVSNYFLARQKDAVKNSIAMLAQSLYSHEELHKKNQSNMQEMSFQKGHNWNDLHFSKKRGSTIVKNTYFDGILISDDLEWDDISYEKDKTTYWNECKQLMFINPIIRNKWEVVKTPMKFDSYYFEKFLGLEQEKL